MFVEFKFKLFVRHNCTNSIIDAVDHHILNDVLRRRFGVSCNALDWLSDFVEGRTSIVRTGDGESVVVTLK